jgi:hypothetical protein
VADIAGQLAELGKDLITRQVNLIIATGGMSAEPMPADPVAAMRQVYRWYFDRLLGEPGSEADNQIGSMNAAMLATAFSELADGLRADSRDARRTLAGFAPPQGPAGASPVVAASQRLVLRMRATSRDLAQIAAHLAAGTELTPSERSVLRKAWEIGTDEVIMQTTISVDGDVVFRADSRYTSEAHQALFDLHDRSCASAMRTWKDVVGAAIDLVKGMLK